MAVTVRGTDILFNDGTTQSTAAGGAPTVSAGNFYQPGGSDLGSGTVSSTSPRRIRLSKMLVSGTVRVQWVLYANGYGTTYGRIYKNGVATGALRSTTAYTTYTDDISVSIGDTIELYIYGSNANSVAGSGLNIGVNSQVTYVTNMAWNPGTAGNWASTT